MRWKLRFGPIRGDAAPSTQTADLFGDSSCYAPRPVGTTPTGASAWGVHDLVGGVWEWTATSFDGYPGFRAYPYRESSEVFFGHEYAVLRGGSWAVDRSVARTTFRNWDFPIRRQIFAGFRLVQND